MTTENENPGRFDVRSVTFEGDDVQITYMHLPNDVRAKGALVATHTLTISNEHPGWHNEIRDVKNAVWELLEDAHSDFEEATPVTYDDLFPDDEEDEEKGMGE